LAGLDPAAHVFSDSGMRLEDVDARAKSAQGDL
jgi:hypothetical protein